MVEWSDDLGSINPKTGLPRGGVKNRYLHTYPGLIDFIYEKHHLGVALPKTSTFQFNMMARGTPAKGWSHVGETTDVFLDAGASAHDEGIGQRGGRAEGIDKRTQEQGKKLWAPRRTLIKLYEATMSVPFFLAKLKDGVGFPDLIRQTTDEIFNSTGIMVDTLQVTTKTLTKRSRAGNERKIVEENKKMKAALEDTETHLERVEFPDTLVPVPINRHAPVVREVQASSASSASTDPSSDDVIEGIRTVKSIFMGMLSDQPSSRKSIISKLIRSHDNICSRDIGGDWASLGASGKDHRLRNFFNTRRLNEWGVRHEVVGNVFTVRA